MVRESLDPVTLYFNGIKRLQTLSKEEIGLLWKKAKRGDKKAKKRLVEANLRLVIPIAKKFYRPGIGFLDLVEEGNLGLMHAVEKFDPLRGFRFSTYASYWIEQGVRRALDEQSKTIRIPPHALESLRRWLKEWDRMYRKLGRNPTQKEMGDRLNLTARQIKGILDAREASFGMGSLDAPIDGDEQLFIRDIITDKNEPGPDDMLMLLRTHDELKQSLNQLEKRERVIIEMRFGLGGKERLTLDKVGKKLKISRERVRQLEERSIARLKRIARRVGLI